MLYKKRIDNNGNTSTHQDALLLQKNLATVKRELDIFKMTRCFPEPPRKQKLEAMEKIYTQYPEKYSIREICRIINLPHGTFYNYHFRRVKETQYEKNKKNFRDVIKRIFEESERRLGATKTYNKMKTEGYKVDRKTVCALFKEMNLKSKHCKKRSFVQKKERTYKYLKNILDRNFYPSAPNKFWVGDTTSIWISKNRFYLCVIIDLFARKVVAYRLASQDNAKLSVNTFKDAFENRNCPSNIVFHSDKGNSFVADEFQSLLRSLKVMQSCSRSGNPYDNAVIEAFFSNMKREELNSNNFEYLDEVKECIDKYMKYYNDYRPHDSLKNKTPSQAENEFYETL